MNQYRLIIPLLLSLNLTDLQAKDFDQNADANYQRIIRYSHPAYQGMSLDSIEETLKEVSEQKSQKSIRSLSTGKMVEVKTLIVDTRDKKTCARIELYLQKGQPSNQTEHIGNLCEALDENHPFKTVALMRSIEEVEFRKKLNMELLSSTDRNLFTATRNIAFASLAVVGVLYALPEDVSHWDKDKFQENPLKQYKKHVKEGPVWDNDHWAINFIGHPISGAFYYQIAKNEGLTGMQSFGYSVLMSTFFWEYGIESFFETPSIQDLVLTPVLGSLLGEGAFKLRDHIAENDGRFLNSKRVGHAAMYILNPTDSLRKGVNKVLGSQVIKQTEISTFSSTSQTCGSACFEGIIGIRFDFKF